jgi:hypothetical protein
VIADITQAKGILQELERIVWWPTLSRQKNRRK